MITIITLFHLLQLIIALTNGENIYVLINFKQGWVCQNVLNLDNTRSFRESVPVEKKTDIEVIGGSCVLKNKG